MSKVLAFDLGASNGRAIVGIFDGKKLDIEIIHRFSNNILIEQGKLYWDVILIFEEIKKGIKLAFDKHKEISSLAIDNWGVDYALLDSEGKLIDKPFCYRDKRTNKIKEEVFKKIKPEELYKKTGIQNMQINTVFQLYSTVINNKNKLDKANHLLFIPDLINYYLTGKIYNEYTISSTSGLLNITNRDWEKDIIERLKIPKGIFNKILFPGEIIGKIKNDIIKELTIPNIDVVSVASHDTQSVAVSIPANKENYVYINCGTWSIIGLTNNCPIINDKSYKHGFSNEGGICKDYNFLKNIVGMWIIQECLKEWNKFGNYTYSILEKEAENANKIETIIDTDDDTFMLPGNMIKKINDYCKKTNQIIPQTVGEITRVIYQSIALKYKLTIDSIEKITGKPVEIIHIVGGGSKSKLMCQMTADAAERKVISGPVEAAAIGNILVQLIANGSIRDANSAREIVIKSFEITTYLPSY